MFTGLIEETGTIISITDFDGGKEFTIKADKVMSDLEIDHSISVNGACQTVTKYSSTNFTVQAVKETLDKTNFLSYKIGTVVNLERAMKADTRLGGHFVQGHVNGVGKFISLDHRGENKLIGIQLKENLLQYCIHEGSITIDGISLTISDIKENTIYISIIPHTWSVTNLHERTFGDDLNIEVDVLAKYIFQFMSKVKIPKE